MSYLVLRPCRLGRGVGGEGSARGGSSGRQHRDWNPGGARSMLTLRAAMCLARVSSHATADDWQRLTGAEIRTALTARVLAWPGGQRQNFLADGRTLYEGDRAQRGRWRIEGDRYCPVWPPSDRWDCYLVERHVRGLDLRFLSGGEAVTEGRYDDLQ